MSKLLPANPNIEQLKKQAKKLLKQHRSKDATALARVSSLHPKPEHFYGLRDAQLVVAREFGFDNWRALHDAVEITKYAAASLSEKADIFIQLGCVQYNGSDSLRNYRRAQALLKLHPEIAEFSFYTALVSNNKNAVLQHLETDPQLANKAAGPLSWPALLYATYSRVEGLSESQSSIEIVQHLLDNGADVNSHIILNDRYRFSALSGAMGEGEQGSGQPPHQYADALAQILLEAGANPNEGQGLYNTMFTDSGDKWLGVLIRHGLNASHKLNWHDDKNDVDLTTFDYQLTTAANRGYSERVKMLLRAGANPNTIDSYNGKSIHSNALLCGRASIAELLIECGATAQQLTIEDQFKIACVGADNKKITALLERQPQLKNNASLLHHAAEYGDKNTFKHLISSGFDVDGQANYGRTLLHYFALNNDIEQLEYLLNLGADATIRDSSYQSTAAGFAAHAGSSEALYLLLDRTDNFIEVVCCAYLKRAQELLKQNPALARQPSPQGYTALHIIGAWLTEEVDHASGRAFIEFLLNAGADIRAKNKEGLTPLEFNRASGAETMADLLSEYSNSE